MNHHALRACTLLLSALLAACAAPIANTVQATTENIAKYSELSALDIVTALEKNVNDAKQASMPFLAPHYFGEAAQTLNESQSGLSHLPKDKLAQQAAKGDAILDKGRSVMAIVQYRFARELELKTQLDKLNTAKNLPKEYEKIIGNFSGLIEIVEREKPDNIDKDKDALYKSMQELEIRSVQEGALRDSEAINNDSRNKNADKQVPATYADAVRTFQEAKTQIAADAHNNELVLRLGTQALFAARHAQQLNDRVVELQARFKGTAIPAPALALATGGAARISTQVGGAPAIEKGTVEKIALMEEDRLNDISTALGYKDLRDLPLEKQAQELQHAAANAATQAKNEAGIAANKDLQTRLRSANDDNAKTTAQLAERDQQLAERNAKILELNARIMGLENSTAGK